MRETKPRIFHKIWKTRITEPNCFKEKGSFAENMLNKISIKKNGIMIRRYSREVEDICFLKTMLPTRVT